MTTATTLAAPSLSALHLKRILPNLANPEDNFRELEKALVEFNITTFDRVAQFLGQVGGETEGGRLFEELYNDPPGKEAYFRSFLGDQWKYHGHGAIHLTWRDAYEKAAAYFKAPQIVNDPDIVSKVEWRWRTACWFWSAYKDINTPADHANFNECMRLVLGTSQHPSREKRWDYYVRACQNLPIPFAIKGEYHTRGDRGLAHLWPLRGRVPYRWWNEDDYPGGAVPDGGPAYATNGPPPSREVILGERMFCAAVPTIMLRVVGKRIPTRGDSRYDGGIAAYFGGVFGPGYFDAYMHPLNRGMDLPHLTLLGSKYWGNANQGHTGVVLGNAKVLDENSIDGFQSSRWLAGSIADFGYTHYVWPWDWINYRGDEADWFKNQ